MIDVVTSTRLSMISSKFALMGCLVLFFVLVSSCDGAKNKIPASRDTFAMSSNIGKMPIAELPTKENNDHSRLHHSHTISRSSFLASTMAAITLPAAAEKAMATPEPGSGLQSTSLPIAATVPTAKQESISGFVAGASLSTVKTLVKFPLDTATVRLQIPNSDYSLTELGRLFRGSYSGVTLSLLSNIPGGAVFFAVKDATKAGLKTTELTAAAPRWFTTSVAVAAALIPYWIIRNPSEVVKVRQQAGLEGYGDGVSPLDALKSVVNESNGTVFEVAQEFYTGYWENILYGLPADVIKFVAYEAITDGRKDLSPIEGAVGGALATAIAQLVTTPLDVVRNRLMTGKDQNGVPISEEAKSRGYLQSLISLAEEEGTNGFFAGASPRVAKAFLSGAIQFATYEETKQSIAKLLQR